MCGRYVSTRSRGELAHLFAVDLDGGGDEAGSAGSPPAQVELRPDWNVAPTKTVYAVLERTPDGVPGARPVRRLRPVRWGLVPAWAKDTKIGSRLVNARVETVADKPAFRRAFASRRCLLPADGYYEWYVGENGAKTPFFVRPRDGGVLAMAGLYELWRDPEAPAGDPGGRLWTATVLTTEATDELGRLHSRMPLLVRPEHHAAWLDPGRRDPAALRDLLVPAAPGLLEAYPVSAAVGNVRNNGPRLTDPLPSSSASAPG